MKKFFFLFAMLVSVTASAQSTVQIMPISATYITTPTIQFKVSWTNQTTADHRNKVWIFVDFQMVVSPTEQGSWQPATITGTVQKTAGTVSEQSNRGFFLEGTATNFSSTVTVQLSNTITPFNWCAYGSDYPPNAASYNNGTYTLKGTQPFVINGNGAIQNGNKYIGTIINSLTDATGCPGGVGRDQPHNGGTCAPGLTAVGNYCRDLTADAAIKAICNGQEIEAKNKYQCTNATNITTLNCPDGWRPTSKLELECLYMNYRSQCGLPDEVWLFFQHVYTNSAWNLQPGIHCVTCDSHTAHYHLAGYNLGDAECWYGATRGQIVPMCDAVVTGAEYQECVLCVR